MSVMNHVNTPKIFFASKLSVINATMAYAMYKKTVTNPCTEVEGKYKITKTLTVVMKKYYVILVLFNDMILYDAAVIVILHETHHTKIT